jgi:aquaporin NIP
VIARILDTGAPATAIVGHAIPAFPLSPPPHVEPASTVATEQVRAHIAEFSGTFALVFFGCGAIAVGRLGDTGVALAFGLVIAVAIYALGHISGAHFNPAVSVGFAIGSHFPWSRVVTYAVAQTAGAISGAALLRLSLGDVPLGVTQPGVSVPSALLWEAVMTGLLVVVITAVATDTRAVGQGAALAIGGSVALAALVGGPLTGASLNPARSIGPAIVAGDIDNLWIYLVGPVLGAAAGAVLYRYLRETAR